MNTPFRLTIRDIFSLSGLAGMSITGFIESGRVSIGDKLVVRTESAAIPVEVLKIQTLSLQDLDSFEGADTEVAIHLTGVERKQLKSGYVLSSL
jgi:selenocysteine-specific translation elongation factor